MLFCFQGTRSENQVTETGNAKKQLNRDEWESLSPIQKAIRYLAETQVTEEGRPGLPHWIGGWPEQMDVQWGRKEFSLPDVSAMPALIIHCLSVIDDKQSAPILGLSSSEVELVARMRRKAVKFLKRLEIYGHGELDGSYGYWPLRPRKNSFWLSIVNTLTRIRVRAREFNGILGPLHAPKMPAQHQIWPDADDTAWVYSAYLDHALAENLPKPDFPAEQFFGRWRDTGDIPVIFPKWRGKPTGAFLTWFAGTPEMGIKNDVDVIVNANVLAALGRYGRLDLPGADDAIRFISTAIEAGYHKCNDDITLYYPDDLAIKYAVIYAYRMGKIPEFGSAAEILAAAVEQQVKFTTDDLAYWEGWRDYSPAYTTSVALLTLLNSGNESPLIAGGCRWLETAQDQGDGSWPTVAFAWSDQAGIRLYWKSQALTTAFALAALCRYRLEKARVSAQPLNSG